MDERLHVAVGKDWDGFTFRLRPSSREMLRREYPNTKMLPQISISFDERTDFDAIEKPTYQHILEMLTGLEFAELQRSGGGRFIDAVTEELLYDTTDLF